MSWRKLRYQILNNLSHLASQVVQGAWFLKTLMQNKHLLEKRLKQLPQSILKHLLITRAGFLFEEVLWLEVFSAPNALVLLYEFISWVLYCNADFLEAVLGLFINSSIARSVASSILICCMKKCGTYYFNETFFGYLLLERWICNKSRLLKSLTRI